MTIDKATLDRHLAYTIWATNHLLNAASGLKQEQLLHDFHTADKNIVGTLAHAFAADRVWFDRVNGRRRTVFIEDRDRNLDTLRQEWPVLHQGWRQWLSGMEERQIHESISYQDIAGNPYQSLPWEIVLHVVNHGTHHRGQVSGMIRALGQAPPQLDLIRFYRGL
jgi:uncharacterized damage-inducible protein DinB